MSSSSSARLESIALWSSDVALFSSARNTSYYIVSFFRTIEDFAGLTDVQRSNVAVWMVDA